MPKKDIFIDNNIAKNFSNPLDPEYKKLICWLMKFDANPKNCDQNAYLVVSQKLLAEYIRTIGHAASGTAIPAIINQFTREGRLHKISNDQIKDFKKQYFTKKQEKRFTSNQEDREHIPVVLLSDRKYALTLDEKFTEDLLNFPSFIVMVGKKPTDIPYDQ
jgi:hypothetical protein